MSKTTANSFSNTVLDVLRATYKTVFIPAIDAGREIGFAEKTTRNMLSEGRFPIPTEKIGAKRVVSIFVLADFVMQRSHISPSVISPERARKGARTKAVRMRAQGRA
jgi:hypothetical protein